MALLWLNSDQISLNPFKYPMHTLNWNELHSFEDDENRPIALKPLAKLPVVVMVGLTGVGKTSSLELLTSKGVIFTILPNRREITDELIIATLQREDDQRPHPITDRIARFGYTTRYRARYPGGMAYALSRLALDPMGLAMPLIFDGLRGLEEVQQATFYFPDARFIILDAPDIIRLRRLLNRADSFDTAAAQSKGNHPDLLSRLAAIPNVETVFNPEALNQIARIAQNNQELDEEIIQKASIIVAERHNYDSRAAGSFLSDTLPPERLLMIDTAAQPAHIVVERIAGWLKGRP
jgi:hypothetical protein